MKRQLILILAMVAVISISGPTSFTDMVSFQGLGDFPGGPTNSCAYGISGDGSPVVGYGWSESGQEAFRWTASGGMQSLGLFSGGSWSVAKGIYPPMIQLWLGAVPLLWLSKLFTGRITP